MVYRVYVEKKKPFAVEAKALEEEIRGLLGVAALKELRLIQRYDVEGIPAAVFAQSLPVVFSEPPVDNVFDALPDGDAVFAIEYLPGQFDQRADSAAECIQLLCGGERPTVRSARVYVLNGALSADQIESVRRFLINPVEARLATLEEKETLQMDYPQPDPVAVLNGFRDAEDAALPQWIARYGLAMDAADLKMTRDYFRGERRDPTMTELRVLDTYWSDHCRHTTFLTRLENIEIADPRVQQSYDGYRALRDEIYAGRAPKPQTLMDIATIGAKALRRRGLLARLDESDEINACSIRIDVDVDGTTEPWLLQFKNETHNHPTEIEPFGGAATCLGGAIRDPLSGRSYVYQAMRVTGAGDPLTPLDQTLPGKLPQRKLVTTAAAGYASYGNQIGLATGPVREIYHPGYVAKRMEIGAVLGAVPLENVVRETPKPGDVVLLIGGRTGRDGCGGATGSSKAHSADSLDQCGAEVQKGNPPVERKLQRLFRNPAAARLILRCNDFGAGGVAVAIGELADGLRIDLNAVPKKYEGLDGTELAISESQERMAVVVDAADAETMVALAGAENLEATPVAVVEDTGRLVMCWNGAEIVNISRAFLDTNGAEKQADVRVAPMQTFIPKAGGGTFAERMAALAGDLNACSQKGLSERFDSTIGAATVLMPFGGKHQRTPAQSMVAKLPVPGETKTCSGMAFGFDPFISENNPYEGAYFAVAESAAKLVASGFSHTQITLSLQEYFERLGGDPARWGKPFAALLGALQAQLDLGLAAVGGKDSMSGSFEQLDVPPTLVSFAVADGVTDNICSPEFKAAGNPVVWLAPRRGGGLLPDPADLLAVFGTVARLIADKSALSVYAAGRTGIAGALLEMPLGNEIGVALNEDVADDLLFSPSVGGFVIELNGGGEAVGVPLGVTTAEYTIRRGGDCVDGAELARVWARKLESVFPYSNPSGGETPPKLMYTARAKNRCAQVIDTKPRALIPVFPGTNCEYDTAHAVRRAGGEAEILVIRNLTPAQIAESADAFARLLARCQMLILPGGFSGGDEPEGSAKLINAFLRTPVAAEALTALLERRDGLVLGVCNGFQALVKLGLVPHGRICAQNGESAALTFNRIGRHQSMLVGTRVASVLSPWLQFEEVGAVHTIAVSHGEGRFVCDAAQRKVLAENGQIAAQYVDLAGEPSMEIRFNPNGSDWAIEAVTSPDGRVLGKMGHTERAGDNLYRNVPGNKFQKLYEGGVHYFK